LTRFVNAAQAAVRLKGQVTVLLTTDAAIRKLNLQFRGKNKATDVLSFPAAPMPGLKAAQRPAGDLAISVTTALRQAEEQGHSLATEIKVLILHGLLHLAGLDHEIDDGAMARRELRLRGQLKLPKGLIERTGMGVAEERSAGAKARIQLGARPARLKSSPDTKLSEASDRVQSSSGAKARAASGGGNARAKARTLQPSAPTSRRTFSEGRPAKKTARTRKP
jgi:probable rRNA maturation factor